MPISKSVDMIGYIIKSRFPRVETKEYAKREEKIRLWFEILPIYAKGKENFSIESTYYPYA